MRHLGALTAVAFVLALCSCAGLAQGPASERILAFDSRIVVQPDGMMTVTDTIRARALGQVIRHGLVRQFITSYTDASGRARPLAFEVVAFLRDGQPARYETEDREGTEVVYLGTREELLEPGVRTFQLTYHIERPPVGSETTDELVWPVTGYAMPLAVDEVTATVVLEGVGAERLVSFDAWTGRLGASEQFYTAEATAEGIAFKTTAPLLPGEGMAVRIRWEREPAPGAGA